MTVAGTMAGMTGPAIAAAASRGAAVLLPLGVVENHGPHLPTGTDVLIATALCRRVQFHAARELVIAPPVAWGVNHVLKAFPGSFRIRPGTARDLLIDVLASLAGDGFREVFVVSHHGDLAHNRVVLEAVDACRAGGHVCTRWLYAPNWPAMPRRLGRDPGDPVFVPWHPPDPAGFRLTGTFGVHADEWETAAMVRWYPELVNFDALRDLAPTALTAADLPAWREGGDAARHLTPDGYFGAPNPVDPELWRFFEDSARRMAAAIGARP